MAWPLLSLLNKSLGLLMGQPMAPRALGFLSDSEWNVKPISHRYFFFLLS